MEFFTNPQDFAKRKRLRIPSVRDIMGPLENYDLQSLYSIFLELYPDLNIEKLAEAYQIVQNKINKMPQYSDLQYIRIKIEEPDLLNTFLLNHALNR